ncbi:hypothetical protein MKW98_018135 [Papaver atlanticum]|uniref:Uncharacterized protein n=1 Tax=Papaver atlanticum TaxID=357466 RepID=A0AAD4XBW0_9MAGN|nr:hypothetical protein MKW98_018135 [Papaver atlanticum]
MIPARYCQCVATQQCNNLRLDVFHERGHPTRPQRGSSTCVRGSLPGHASPNCIPGPDSNMWR